MSLREATCAQRLAVTISKKTLVMTLVLAAVLLTGIGVLAARTPRRDICTERPSFEQTANALATCMGTSATAGDFESVLLAWERIETRPPQPWERWGGVTEADVLPGGGKEIMISYHADLNKVKWDPQGKLVILQRDGERWRIAFDASEIKLTRTNRGSGSDDEGRYTVWDNWAYRVAEATDVTGDGLDDLWIELSYSNMTHVFLDYVMLLTAQSNGGSPNIRVAFLEDTSVTHPTFRFASVGNRHELQSVHLAGVLGANAVTRTFSFENGAFVLSNQVLDPPRDAIQLLQELDAGSAITTSTVISKAYGALGAAFQYTPGKRPAMRDELVILDVVNLKLIQIAAVRGQDLNDLSFGSGTFLHNTFRDYVIKTNGTAIFSDLGSIFVHVWLATKDYAQACETIARFADENPDRTLVTLRGASHHAIDYTGQGLCIKP
jgi:hypothetical protein